MTRPHMPMTFSLALALLLFLSLAGTTEAAENPQPFDFVAFISENTLGIVSVIVGILGTLYGYISYRSNEKNKRTYEFLFDLAEKNIDKKITEESLQQKKEEVENATAEIKSLQKQIKDDIPKEARRAVIKDKINTYCIDIVSTYKKVCTLQKEIESLEVSNEIPPEMLKEIERVISPDYLLREKRENLKTYLAILTGLAALTSTVFPWEISRIISTISLLGGFVVLVLLFKNSFKGISMATKLLLIRYFLYFMGGISIFVVVLVSASFVFNVFNDNDLDMYIVLSPFLIISLITFVLSIKINKKVVKARK